MDAPRLNDCGRECFVIGGRFIAEDPDCPVHGTEAQREEHEMQEFRDALKSEGHTDADIEAIMAAMPDGGASYIDFEGQNCDDCVGWDGISRRCACGNRRVDWEISDGFAYGVAY